ncbi:TonB-dependent receptor [Croceicoccus estronivorus]|nr:TonB-dependent receptor [Croceicoccus estronivorus]
MAIAWSSGAEAREADRTPLNIPASTLPEAITELSREAHVSIGAQGALPHIATPAVRGRMSVEAALARLLAGSGYVARRVGENAWRIEREARAKQPVAPTTVNPVLDQPIVVTAAKRGQILADLPMGVTVVSLDSMHRVDPRGGTVWLAGEMEGLSLTGLGPGRNRMFVRGVADSAFNGESQSTVAVLLDDARLTYSAPDPDIRLIDVDRVEVLKGPQGSLYGTGALGGIYHIVTRRAELDETSLDMSAGAETVAHGGAGYSVSAVANLPLVAGAAALRLVGYHAREPGWVDTGTRADANSGRVLGARAGLGLVPGDGWRADVTAFAQWLEADDSQYVYSPEAYVRPGQIAEPHDNDLRHLSARIGREGGKLNIVMNSAITWHEVSDTMDATIGADAFGLTNPQVLDDQREYRVWDSEVRLSGAWGHLQWLGGLSHVEARQSNLWTLSAAATSLALVDDRRVSSETALFGDVTLPLTSRVSLDVGARLFRSVVEETRVLADNTVTHELRRNGMTPSLALSWRPHGGRLIYVRYGSALRQGGADIGTGGDLDVLKSDELATIEAGWREQLPGGASLDIGVHWSWWENVQSDTLRSDGLIETVNAGNAQIMGAEIAFEQPLGSGWKLAAGATYERARLLKNALGYEIEDRHLPVVPDYTVRGALSHDFSIGDADASFHLSMRYIGPARLSFDPLLDRPMGRILESKVEVTAQWAGCDFALAGENLFNRRDDSFAFGNPLRFATMRQYTPQSPLRVSLAVRKSF